MYLDNLPHLECLLRPCAMWSPRYSWCRRRHSLSPPIQGASRRPFHLSLSLLAFYPLDNLCTYGRSCRTARVPEKINRIGVVSSLAYMVWNKQQGHLIFQLLWTAKGSISQYELKLEICLHLHLFKMVIFQQWQMCDWLVVAWSSWNN